MMYNGLAMESPKSFISLGEMASWPKALLIFNLLIIFVMSFMVKFTSLIEKSVDLTKGGRSLVVSFSVH